jgi:hypothetical protein
MFFASFSIETTMQKLTEKPCYALGRSIVYNQVLAEIGLRIKGSFVEFETETKGNGLRPGKTTEWR